MNNTFEGLPPVGVQVNSSVASKPKIAATTVASALPANVGSAVQSDTVELSQQKENKKGPIKKFKEFIANVKKFFATAGAYTAGTIKGLVGGFIGASVVYTGGELINAAKNAIAEHKGIESAGKIPNKPLAVVVAVATLAVSLWNASLDASEERSDIEHRWTGHNQ